MTAGPMIAAPLGYRPALDGLRAVAVTLVVVHHAWPWLLPGGGTAGVGLFFTLSGFLITTLLCEEHAGTGRVSFRAFYRRRLYRLTPALVTLVAAYVAWTGLSGDDDPRPALATSAVTLAYLGDVWSFLLHRPLASGLSHTWSLAIEEHFYLAWPVVLTVLLWPRFRGRLTTVLVLTVVGGVALRAVLGGAGLTLGNSVLWLDALPIGCLLAVVFVGGRLSSGLAGTPVTLVAGATLLTVAALDSFSHATDIVVGEPLIALASVGLVIAALAPSRVTQRVLAGRTLVLIGSISYALYLWSWPSLLLARRFVESSAAEPLGLALAAALAFASTRLIEDRFRRGRRSLASPEPILRTLPLRPPTARPDRASRPPGA